MLKHGEPSSIPILIAVPHAGRSYPPALLEDMRDPAFSTLKLEDRYADRLAEAVAERTGASLLVAQAPRAMIDLNRGTQEMDWTMLAGGRETPASGRGKPVARRARGGLGLVPRRLPDLGEIWKGTLDPADLKDRVEGIYQPYHAELSATLASLRSRWGAALLVDLHSMPPLAPASGRGAEIVVGDRFGASCDGGLVASAFAHFAAEGVLAVHNRPYAGGYILDTHARPRNGVNAVQIEVCRRTYLDARQSAPGPGLDRMVEVLTGLVDKLAEQVAMLGQYPTHRDAAE